MKRRLLITMIFILFLFRGVALGARKDVDITGLKELAQDIVQGEFRALSREFGVGLSLVPMAPADPLRLKGFDIGIELTGIDINEDAIYWRYSLKGKAPSLFPIPKIHVQKGLPLALDIGAIYSYLPNSNVQLIGGEIKWSFIQPSAVKPAIALRGAYTRLMGVPNLSLQTERIELSISKKLLVFTPYAGVGVAFIQSDPHLPEGLPISLESENLTEFMALVGLKISLAIFKLTLEADFSRIPLYSIKLSIGL